MIGNNLPRITPVEFSGKYNLFINQLQLKLTEAETALNKLLLENELLKTPGRFTYNDIKDNDNFFCQFYTSCQNNEELIELQIK